MSGTDVPLCFLKMSYEFIRDLGGEAWSSCRRLLAAGERGDKNDQFHVHLFALLKHSRTAAAMKALRKKLVDLFFPGGVAASKIKFQVKLAKDTVNDIKYVTGYVQKDDQRPGFELLHDPSFTPEVLAAAKLHFGAKKQLVGGATKALTKTNFLFEIESWMLRHAPELIGIAGLVDSLYFMLNSGVYCMAVGWVSGSNGMPLNRERAAALFRMSLNGAARVSRDDIELVIHSVRPAGFSAQYARTDPSIRNPDLEGMGVAQAREAIAQQRSNLDGPIHGLEEPEEYDRNDAGPSSPLPGFGTTEPCAQYVPLDTGHLLRGGAAAHQLAPRLGAGTAGPFADMGESPATFFSDRVGNTNGRTDKQRHLHRGTKRFRHKDDLGSHDEFSSEEEAVAGEFDAMLDDSQQPSAGDAAKARRCLAQFATANGKRQRAAPPEYADLDREEEPDYYGGDGDGEGWNSDTYDDGTFGGPDGEGDDAADSAGQHAEGGEEEGDTDE
jgi:hypothetical protein